MARGIPVTVIRIPGDQLATDTDSTHWGPIACGDHSPSQTRGVPDPLILGFQRICPACVATWEQTKEHIQAVHAGRTLTFDER